MNVAVIAMYRNEKVKPEAPTLFISSTVQQCVEKAKTFMIDQMGVNPIDNTAGFPALIQCKSSNDLSMWFEDHYCSYAIELQQALLS